MTRPKHTIIITAAISVCFTIGGRFWGEYPYLLLRITAFIFYHDFHNIRYISIVIGHKEGIDMMEQADPLVLLLGLPSIPVALILGRLICWEDAVLNFMRRHFPKVPVIHNMLPFRGDIVLNETSTDNDIPPATNPISATRILCGALLMPTIANLFGKLFYSSVKSNFQRTILGGLTFITVKGFLRIYHKQQQYIRQCQRKILDYTENNISTYIQNRSTE